MGSIPHHLGKGWGWGRGRGAYSDDRLVVLFVSRPVRSSSHLVPRVQPDQTCFARWPITRRHGLTYQLNELVYSTHTGTAVQYSILA